MQIRWNALSCFAQLQDVGPCGEDDFDFVFGKATMPRNAFGARAGLDVSPAVRHLAHNELTYWRFADETDVPGGPWTETVTTSGNNRWAEVRYLQMLSMSALRGEFGHPRSALWCQLMTQSGHDLETLSAAGSHRYVPRFVLIRDCHGEQAELHARRVDQGFGKHNVGRYRRFTGGSSAILDANAPSDAAAFKAWLRGISQKVAEAGVEGGFLGFGGVKVSDAEKATSTTSPKPWARPLRSSYPPTTPLPSDH